MLSDPNMKDDELLRVLNLVMSEEAERVVKQKKTVKVHSATASAKETSATETLQKTVSELVTQMKAMQKEMEASRNDANGQASGRQPTSWKKRGCQQCRDSGNASCNHCWKCGVSGHMSRQCQQNPLNRNALPGEGGSQ